MIKDLAKNKTIRISSGIFLGVLIYLILISALVFVEKDSAQSSIRDFPNAIWYSIATLTTVGYGDLFPATVWGRGIGYLFLLGSLIFYGILIGQFATLMGTIKENKKLGYNGTTFDNHAVIIGWNDFGKLVVDQLQGVGKKIAIVTNNRDDIDFIHEQHKSRDVFTLFADFTSFDLLKKVNIEQSSIVFINLNDDTEKLVYILNMKKHYPDLDYVVTLENGDLKNTFITAGVTNTISKHEISSKLLASYMFEPDVAAYSESILSFAQTDTDYDIKQFYITNTNPYVGQSYQEVFFDLKRRYNTILIGITKRDKFGKKRLIKNPLGDLKIAPGDYVIIILNGKAFKLLRKVFGVDEGYIKENQSD
jgi:voltage-gated potassium channel